MITIITTCPLGWTVLAASGFSSWKFSMPRYDEMTSAGSHMVLSSFRRIRMRDFKKQVPLVPKTHEMLILDFLWISDMCPKWMGGSN
jgi:hypothetical protein